MITVNIEGKNKTYPIYITNNKITKENIIEIIGGRKYVVVISERVEKLYGKILDFENKFILKDGEKEKNLKNYQKILDFCFKNKLSRNDVIIAIGGGVVGDIAGFVASTYMRGINIVQVPTTLLACVDSSVGGKTAVNNKYGKNLIGAFYQPEAVVINTNFLTSLSDRDFKTGLGEVVKYGFIEKSCQCSDEYNLINFLEANSEQILERNPKVLKYMIEICINLKIYVVQKDEKEEGLRRILNFGHTYGHAIEQLSKYKYTHGECVIAGIIFAFELALKNNLIDKNYKFFMEEVLKKFDFKEVKKYELNKIIPLMKTDKKSANNKIRFILPTGFAAVKDFEFNDLLTIS